MRHYGFNESITREPDGPKIYAWAKFKDGDVPPLDDYNHLDSIVKAKYPNAKLVSMTRQSPMIPPVEPDTIIWLFKWESPSAGIFSTPLKM